MGNLQFMPYGHRQFMPMLLPWSEELQIREEGGIAMLRGRVSKSVSTYHAQNKVQT